MRVYNLLDKLEYGDSGDQPKAEPMYVKDVGRALRYVFKPGQFVPLADAPSSPFFYVVIQGHVTFKDESGREQRVGPNTFIIFEPGEKHEIHAGKEQVVMLAVMRETDMERRESARERTGIGR